MGDLVSAVQVLLFLAVVLIALRNGRLRRTDRAGPSGWACCSARSRRPSSRLVDPSGPGAALASAWTALILLLAVFFIVRQVLAQPEITLQSIYGVLSAYMMIGLIYAAVYVAMWKFSSDPSFFANGDKPNSKLFQYFSFTTLTTLGYGDFTAAGDGGPGRRRAGGHGGPDVPGHPGRPAGGRLRWSDRAAARRGGHPASTEPAQHGAGQHRPSAGPPAPGLRAWAWQRTGPASSGSASNGRTSPGPSRAKQASAAGLIRLSPPGAVRGRGTSPRRGGRNGAGGSGPAPAARPADRN